MDRQCHCPSISEEVPVASGRQALHRQSRCRPAGPSRWLAMGRCQYLTVIVNGSASPTAVQSPSEPVPFAVPQARPESLWLRRRLLSLPGLPTSRPFWRTAPAPLPVPSSTTDRWGTGLPCLDVCRGTSCDPLERSGSIARARTPAYGGEMCGSSRETH